MSIPNELRQLTDQFFADNASDFNFETIEGCGQYIEALIPYCQIYGYSKVGFLKYTGSGTKYNNHRIDSFLYNEKAENGKLQSCDVIKDAETDHASAGWSPDTPRYTEADWVATLDELLNTGGGVMMVPWVAYNENNYQRLKQQLAYDYARRPQDADFDVTVWAARVFHSQYMGPTGTPLGFDMALQRHRPEWCAALGISVDGRWF